MTQAIFDTIILSTVAAFSFIWSSIQTTSDHSLQLVIVLVSFYFATRFFSKKLKYNTVNRINANIYLCLTLLLVLSTGGANSPLFFLIYFLLFSLSLLSEPNQSLLIGVLIALLMAIKYNFQIDGTMAINLVTLLLISPLAIIFGQKYLQSLQLEGRIKLLNKEMEVEQTDTLLWITTKALPTITSGVDFISQVIGTNALPYSLQERLKSLHNDLLSLHQSANTLEKEIKKDN